MEIAQQVFVLPLFCSGDFQLLLEGLYAIISRSNYVNRKKIFRNLILVVTVIGQET